MVYKSRKPTELVHTLKHSTKNATSFPPSGIMNYFQVV